MGDMAHYSTVADFIEFMAVDVDVDLRWSKMCTVDGKVMFGDMGGMMMGNMGGMMGNTGGMLNLSGMMIATWAGFAVLVRGAIEKNKQLQTQSAYLSTHSYQLV